MDLFVLLKTFIEVAVKKTFSLFKILWLGLGAAPKKVTAQQDR